MIERKPLEELTLMDDYMFWAVMKRKELLIPLLEDILGIKIVDLQYAKGQETLKESYDSRGVRLDIYAKDDTGKVFNIEVQTTNKRDIPKRARYNQDLADLDNLLPGGTFNDLPETFIIFITAFDTHKRNRCLYWFETRERHEPDLLFGDDVNRIVVNIKGTRGQIPLSLKNIVHYLNTGEAKDEYTRRLDDAVVLVKKSDERKREYMQLLTRENELRNEGRIEGRIEGRNEGRNEGIDLMALLISKLLSDSKYDEIKKAVEQPEYRNELLKFYGLETA